MGDFFVTEGTFFAELDGGDPFSSSSSTGHLGCSSSGGSGDGDSRVGDFILEHDNDDEQEEEKQ